MLGFQLSQSGKLEARGYLTRSWKEVTPYSSDFLINIRENK